MSVQRLKTVVSFDGDTPEQASVSFELFAVLDDGTERLLLADRGMGWAWSNSASSHWSGTTLDKLAEDARTCVGPDEPADGQTQSQATHAHWSAIAEDLRDRHGVATTAAHLAAVPHDIVFDKDVLARVNRSA